MTIEALIKAVPPPPTPFEAFDGPWEPIEAELGTVLPKDYKDFVRVYGSGYFMEFFGVAIPRSDNIYTRLETAVVATCRAFVDDEDLPYPLWPTPGGLLPFGSTDNGDYLFWLTRGHADGWGVVVWDRGMCQCEALNCDLTSFIAGLATGEILPKGFPDDMVECDHLFRPNSDFPPRA